MKQVISCSRRTDIPAFYYCWLQNSLKNKKIELINIYNNKPYIVDLSPENVHSIVLWSKNFQNVINNPNLLDYYNLYFQFTITGYSNIIEPNTPTIEQTIKQMEKLCEKYSPQQINWRFDPILFSKQAENEKVIKCGISRLDMFEKLCKAFSSIGIDRCTMSYLDLYSRVSKRIRNKNINIINIDIEQKIKFAKMLAEVASKYNIQLYSCCDEIVIGVGGIKKSHCIDGEILTKLFGESASKAKDYGQRKTCGCTKSKDIGSYNQKCGHDCIYCYANISSL